MNRSLTQQEEQTLFRSVGECASLEARRDHGWMRALRYSGCRLGEFSMVTVGAAVMALQTRYLFLPRAHRKGGKRDHQVLVTRALHEALADLLQVREELTGIRTEDCDRNAVLVLNRRGRPLTARGYQFRMTYWQQRAGLGVGASPHWFRHTLAIALMRRSRAADPRGVVKQVLGHVDIGTTGIYTEPTREEIQQALETAEGPTRIRRREARREFERRMGR